MVIDMYVCDEYIQNVKRRLPKSKGKHKQRPKTHLKNISADINKNCSRRKQCQDFYSIR